MRIKIQTPIPKPCWPLWRYLGPNTFWIWFYPTWWYSCCSVPFTGHRQPPAPFLRLSLRVLFPGPSLPPSSWPQVQGLLPLPSYILCSFLYIHQPHCALLLVNLGMIFKKLNNWCSTGSANQNTSWLLRVHAQWPRLACSDVACTHKTLNSIKIRASFYSPIYHECPAGLVKVCGLNKSKITWKGKDHKKLVMRIRAQLQTTSACYPYI